MRNAKVAHMEEIPVTNGHTGDPSDPAGPAGPAAEPSPTHEEAADSGCVCRSVEIDAPADEVWDAVADPERRRTWLDDDDALERITRIEGADPGRSFSWTWWRAGDPETATRVHVTLDEGAAGATVVTVTERRLHPISRPGGATARASAATGSPTATAMTSTGGTVSVWDRRLLGLELLFVTLGALAVA